ISLFSKPPNLRLPSSDCTSGDLPPAIQPPTTFPSFRSPSPSPPILKKRILSPFDQKSENSKFSSPDPNFHLFESIQSCRMA
ncbi:hypothetical protein LINGRAHAP2_LOCUS13563, partial [Linum grandiflorum]